MKILKLFALGLTLTILFSSCLKEEIFNAENDLIQQYPALDKLFSEYTVVEIDNDGILDYSKKKHNQEFVLDLKISEKPNWVFSVNFYDFFGEDYKAFETNADGNWVEIIRTDRSDAYHGQSQDLENRAMFIMEDHLFTGNIYEGNKEYFIEPLNRFVKNASFNLYVYYPTAADIGGSKFSCGNTDSDSNLDFHSIGKENSSNTRSNSDRCRELAITYVADFLYRKKFDDKSSSTRSNVENIIRYGSYRYWGRNDYPLYFSLARSYIRTSASNSPAISSKIKIAINQWRSWAPRNIMTSDVNMLFAGGVTDYMGYAQDKMVCKAPAYAVLAKINGISSAIYSKVAAHEVGHNLSCSHEGSGFMKMGEHSSSWMHPSTRHQLDSYIQWNNSCMPNRGCAWYK